MRRGARSLAAGLSPPAVIHVVPAFFVGIIELAVFIRLSAEVIFKRGRGRQHERGPVVQSPPRRSQHAVERLRFFDV